MTASSDAPPYGAADDGEKVLLLAGVADMPRLQRSYYRRLVEGDAISFRLFGAVAFLAIGAVAVGLNVTVERVEDAPMSQIWIQSVCDFRPHLTDDDVFACTKVLFNDPTLGSTKVDPANLGPPPSFPDENTDPTVFTALSIADTTCRRMNIVDFDAGEHDRPYTLPQAGREKSFTAASAREESQREAPQAAVANEDNRAFVYAFVHLHKCGGSFMAARLQEVAAPFHEALGGDAGIAERGDDLEMHFPNFPYMNLVTPELHHYAAWRYRNRQPEAFYSVDAIKMRYINGERVFIKSSEAMGFCDNVDAPCVYLTVLREPVARFMSYYSYICLLGAEGHQAWTEEWLREGRCSLNPLEFYETNGKESYSMIDLLAPGGDNSGRSRCRVEAAKMNLQSNCMRFALLERIDHGMQMMRETMPDLAAIGLPPPWHDDPTYNPNDTGDQNGSEDRLSPEAKQRLENYKKDENMMGKLRELLKDDVEVYNFALSRYDKQWTEPLSTC